MLGEYAAVLQRCGPAVAANTFPEIAAHVASSCETCTADLYALVAFAHGESHLRGNRSIRAISRWRRWGVVAVLLVVIVGFAVQVSSSVQRRQAESALAANKVIPRAPAVVAKVNV